MARGRHGTAAPPRASRAAPKAPQAAALPATIGPTGCAAPAAAGASGIELAASRPRPGLGAAAGPNHVPLRVPDPTAVRLRVLAFGTADASLGPATGGL